MSNKTVKQSILIGALTSSFGIFISKFIGLFYLSPLTELAGAENIVFYSITYNWYDILLKISSAGIPFATSAIVAKYAAKDDYKTVLLIKKLSISLIMALSFIAVFLFVVFAGPIATKTLGQDATIADINNLKTLFMILLIAVILVPFLSSLRGYYQGLKRMDLYASSEVLEQFVRVSIIVFIGYVFVRILKFDSIWAIYVAIAAAGIAALVSIIFFVFSTKKEDQRIMELARAQDNKAINKKIIIKEIISIATPYLLISILGTTSSLINANFFIDYATKLGTDYSTAKLSLAIVQTNCGKLASIPYVLTLGFSSGLVPYITESLETKKYKLLSKQLSLVIDTVLFVLTPMILIFTFFAKEIYFIMYGGANLELAAHLFRVNNLVILTDTIAPILSSILVTVKLRKEAILTLAISTIVKIGGFFLFVKLFGADGLSISTFLASLTCIVSYVLILEKTYDLHLLLILKRLLLTTVAGFVMVLPVKGLAMLINIECISRIVVALCMCAYGLLMLIIYFAVSFYFGLPQAILGIKKISFKELISKIRR